MMKIALLLVLSTVVATTTTVVVEAKGGAAAAPPVDCTSVVLQMADCLSYVTNGSTVNIPEGNCCGGLKSVLKTNAECLCEGFKSSSQFGVVLNVSKALALPDACHVHAPSAAKCGLSLAPTSAPSPAGAVVSPAGAPSGASIANAPAMGPGSSSSEVSPASSPGSNPNAAASGSDFSVQMIVVGLAAALFTT